MHGKILFLILAFVYYSQSYAMEENNNNATILNLVPSLTKMCVQKITQFLIQEKIDSKQVAYKLPIDLIDLIKESLPKKAFIKKSPVNKYLDGIVTKIINERFVWLQWLKNHEQWISRPRIFDMKTKTVRDIKYHHSSYWFDSINSLIIGSKDNKIELWNLINNKQYAIIDAYNLNLEYKNSRKFHVITKFRFPYVVIDDIYTDETGLYFLHLHDNDTITLELRYIITGRSDRNIILLSENKALVRTSLHSDLHPTTLCKYSILNQYNLAEKEWIDSNYKQCTFSKDKKLIGIVWDGLYVYSLDSIPEQQSLPVLAKFEIRGSTIKFLSESSYILSIPNLLTKTPTVYLWHWPTKQLIDTITFNCSEGIHRIFVLPNYVEFMDFSHTLYRMNVDFIKSNKIKAAIDFAQLEVIRFRKRFSTLQDAQQQPIPPAILKTSAAILSAKLYTQSFDNKYFDDIIDK